MSKLLWIVCFGLCCWITASHNQYEISCRFLGIFHVQNATRYSQTYEDARKTCLELNAVIATKEMVERARLAGFEICRYGWTDNSTAVIPRITPNPVCAANYVGLFILQTNATSRLDVFCHNVSDTSEKNCEQYNYRNISVMSHDPTEEEGIDNDSGSSTVSPTHPGLDVSSVSLEPGMLLEEVTTDPEMSTEQEHSGDHTTPTEDGEIKSPYFVDGEKGHTSSTNADDLISVDTEDEKYIPREDDNAQATDPSSNWSSGPKNEIYTHEPPSTDDQDPDATDPDATYPDANDPDATDLNATDPMHDGNTQTKQKRKAAVPEWLIVCVSLVCLALIFSVCIALNARRICGQKKKLIINGNKGSPEDGVIMEQNGDTVKSQEMVQLVSKDQSSDFDQKEPLTQEEIRHEKDGNMKV